MKKFLMKCGHVANAETPDGKPACAICGCFDISEEQPILRNRKARCCYCGKEVKSSFALPFFEFKPSQEYDSYYCGCGGWD